MNEETCEQWRGLLAMGALGDISREETTALAAHREGCEECRAVGDDLASTVSLLAYVDPESIEPTALVPPELSARVLGALHRAGASQRRRRRFAVGAVSMVGALAAALILVAVVSGPTFSPHQRTLALSGSSAVSATAVLVEESWGTSVDFSERGLPAGGVYTVSMKTADGAWWTAGTYRSVSGHAVSATMACAVALDDITGLRVENAKGVTVLTSGSHGASYQ